tara:strand:- start:3779 stop:4810 length:1032 start_codon:yes stop_codon:yes gene_type:complete
MPELSIFERIHSELQNLEIDEIKDLIGHLIKGLTITSPTFNAGTFLYRARKCNDDFNLSAGIRIRDLSYPDPGQTRLGRVNRDGAPKFYCAMSKEVVFFELPGLAKGDELVLSFWRTSKEMLINNIGYTDFIFQELGARRQRPLWGGSGSSREETQQDIILNSDSLPKEEIDKALSKDDNRETKEALSQAFMCDVGTGETYKYKLTTAIGELHLGEIVNNTQQFSGLLYPSSRMSANGDNLALLPEYVDNHVVFTKALLVRVNEMEGTKFSFEYLDSAIDTNTDGSLKWLGRILNWSLGQKKGAIATGVSGPDEYGDYDRGEDGQIAHWVLTDTVTGDILKLG